MNMSDDDKNALQRISDQRAEPPDRLICSCCEDAPATAHCYQCDAPLCGLCVYGHECEGEDMFDDEEDDE